MFSMIFTLMTLERDSVVFFFFSEAQKSAASADCSGVSYVMADWMRNLFFMASSSDVPEMSS